MRILVIEDEHKIANSIFSKSNQASKKDLTVGERVGVFGIAIYNY